MSAGGELHERELIRWLRATQEQRRPGVIVDVGDDAAVVAPAAERNLILTTDPIVDGVHFRLQEAGPEAAGWKAAMRAISDIAAMAGRPRWALVALCLPRGISGRTVRSFSEGLRRACQVLETDLVGGDIAATDGPLTAVVTVVGETGPAGAIRRSGAVVGDRVCVTGRLGGSLLGRHLRFTARVREGLALARMAELRAMIDLSDGLSTDGHHIAEESRVRLELDADCIPLSDDARALAEQDGRSPLWHAMNDGEDYELLFTLPASAAQRITSQGIETVEVTEIGTVIPGRGVALRHPDGQIEDVQPGGWEHQV